MNTSQVFNTQEINTIYCKIQKLTNLTKPFIRIKLKTDFGGFGQNRF